MARLNRYIFILFLALFIPEISFCSAPGKSIKAALKIANRNSVLLDSITQLVVIYNLKPELNTANLVALEKKEGNWTAVFDPIEAGIGRKGFALPGKKREGDSKSPTGLFRLGLLYGYEKTVDTQMPYRQSTSEDKWIDDPESPDYNKPIKGETKAKSFENLKISSDEYKLCMVIEYNMHPIVKGMGSAIFMHLSFGESVNPSSGCVVLTPENMIKLLKWMNPNAKPSVLMGTLKVLNSLSK